MVGKIKVSGVEDRGLADNASEHGGFEVVDHNFLDNAAEVIKSIQMASQEMLHGQGYGEFNINHAAVTQNHDKEAQSAAGQPYVNDAV